tara:strand:- start:167 stop:484 length:318 start_codon:yes stop_codon:yes gene_type:complete
MFIVVGTKTYEEELRKWTKKDRETTNKIHKKLAENPLVGKQLTYSFLREKKIGGKRIYYLVYEDLNLVLLVATSDKKDQQITINHIKLELDNFREIAEKIVKQVS